MAPARGRATTNVLTTERTTAWPVRRSIRSTEDSRQPSRGSAWSQGGNSRMKTTIAVRFAITVAVRAKRVWKGMRPGIAGSAGSGDAALAGIRRRMIVDDPPALGPLPEDDGRHPRQLLPVRHLEPPAAARERRVPSQA